MCLFYLYATAKSEIHICSNKHETRLVHTEALEGHFDLLLITYYLLLITYYLLLITYYLSLITYYLLLIISFITPITAGNFKYTFPVTAVALVVVVVVVVAVYL